MTRIEYGLNLCVRTRQEAVCPLAVVVFHPWDFPHVRIPMDCAIWGLSTSLLSRKTRFYIKSTSFLSANLLCVRLILEEKYKSAYWNPKLSPQISIPYYFPTKIKLKFAVRYRNERDGLTNFLKLNSRE